MSTWEYLQEFQAKLTNEENAEYTALRLVEVMLKFKYDPIECAGNLRRLIGGWQSERHIALFLEVFTRDMPYDIASDIFCEMLSDLPAPRVGEIMHWYLNPTQFTDDNLDFAYSSVINDATLKLLCALSKIKPVAYWAESVGQMMTHPWWTVDRAVKFILLMDCDSNHVMRFPQHRRQIVNAICSRWPLSLAIELVVRLCEQLTETCLVGVPVPMIAASVVNTWASSEIAACIVRFTRTLTLDQQEEFLLQILWYVPDAKAVLEALEIAWTDDPEVSRLVQELTGKRGCTSAKFVMRRALQLWQPLQYVRHEHANEVQVADDDNSSPMHVEPKETVTDTSQDEEPSDEVEVFSLDISINSKLSRGSNPLLLSQTSTVAETEPEITCERAPTPTPDIQPAPCSLQRPPRAFRECFIEAIAEALELIDTDR